MADEIAWLIEFKLSVSARLSYWGKTVEGLGMTEEHLDAIRFCRKEDAEMVIADNGWTEAAAREHMWCGDDALRAKPPVFRDDLFAEADRKAGRILRGHTKIGCHCRYCTTVLSGRIALNGEDEASS